MGHAKERKRKGKSKQMKGKMIAQATQEGLRQAKERKRKGKSKQMKGKVKFQSHTGRSETGKTKEKEREKQANERKNESPEPHRKD